MKAIIYCTEENRRKLAREVWRQFSCKDADFVGYADFPIKCDLLIVEHSLVNTLRGNEVSESGRVFVSFNGRLYDVSMGEEYVSERKRCVDKGRLAEAKDINKALCDIDFICKNTVNLSFPGFFQLETTDYCNSRCIMCEHYFTHNKNAERLSMETLERLRDAIQLSRRINLNGMGEPFVSGLVKNQIDYYVSCGNRIVANTNLSVLDDTLIELIGRHFEWLAISVDGARKQTYESIRKGLSFDVLMENLRRLKERVPHVKKIMSMVIMRQNVCEMPELVKLAHDTDIDQVVFLNLNPNLIIDNLRDVMIHYPRTVEYYSMRALEAGKKYDVNVVVANAGNLNHNITLDDIQDELEEMRGFPMWKTRDEEERMCETAGRVETYLENHSQLQTTTVPTDIRCSGVCDWLLTNCYTDLRGNVSMCCRNLAYRAGKVGRIGEFSEVWNAPLLRKCREIFYSGHVPEACLKCGMIEGGELKYLTVETTPDFYRDTELKIRQKKELMALLGE